MKWSHGLSKFRWFPALVTLTLILCAMGAFSAPPQETSRGRAPDGILYFRLRLNSLDPGALTVEEGRYFIRLTNGVVIGDISVQLEDEKRARLIDKGLGRGLSKFTQIVDLHPGRYTLRVVGQPQWTTSITVTNRNPR